MRRIPTNIVSEILMIAKENNDYKKHSEKYINVINVLSNGIMFRDQDYFKKPICINIFAKYVLRSGLMNYDFYCKRAKYLIKENKKERIYYESLIGEMEIEIGYLKKALNFIMKKQDRYMMKNCIKEMEESISKLCLELKKKI
ncbi:MAG: hypothetical protein ACLPWD_06510 [Methanobacterium sp.]